MTYEVIAHTEEHHIIRFLSDDEYVMYDLFMPGLTDVNVRKYKDHNKAIQETYTLTPDEIARLNTPEAVHAAFEYLDEEDMDILIEVNNLYQNPAIRAEVMDQFRDLLNKTLGILRSPRASYETKCRAGQEVAIRTIYLNQHYGPDFIEAGSDERWKVDKIRLMAR